MTDAATIPTPSVNDEIDKALALLCARFPKCFFTYQMKRRPLEIGIDRDLEAILGDTVDPKILHRALCIYTANVGYLGSQFLGTPRLDLAGNAAGTVTDEEAMHAQARLVGIRAKQLRRLREETSAPTSAPTPTPAPASAPAPTSTLPATPALAPARRRDGLQALREAARRRKAAGAAA